MIDLKALVGEGLQGNPVKRVVENSLVPLQNAMEKNPNNVPGSSVNALELKVGGGSPGYSINTNLTNYRPTIPQIKGHMVELAQAMEEADGAGYASYVSKGKTYNGGKVERELEEVLETTQDYCKKVDCDQLFVAR